MKKTLLIAGAVLLVVFAGFTCLVMNYDKAPVGFEGSEIGFSHMNTRFHNAFGFNELLYKASEYLGYICLAVAASNAILALRDFIRNKGRLSRMDRHHLSTMCFYGAVVFFYVFFEFVIINYRPIEMEASYPSSHTMLGLCVMFSEIALLRKYSGKLHFWGIVLQILCIVLMIAIVVFRLFCGVHWLTDIAGAVLLSAGLILLYCGDLHS